jgi:hypothetical protein
MRFTILLCVLALATASLGANLDRETNELRLSGMVDFDTENNTLVDLEVGVGYFFFDNFEAGLALGVRDDDRVTLFGLGAFVEQNLPINESVVPYLGLSVDAVSVDVDDGGGDDVDENALVLGLQAGLKTFLTEDLAIALQLGFDMATDDVFATEDGGEDTNWVLSLGLRYYFDLFYFAL